MNSLFPRCPKPFFIACALSYCLMMCSIVFAAPSMENPAEVSWNISALSVTFDAQKKRYIAKDEVIITGGTTRLEADYVEFSNETKDAFARGHVVLVAGEDSITCTAMEFNLARETGTIHQGSIFIQKNNFYIRGDKLQKTGKDTYTAEKASLTSCEGESPDWKITGKNIKVTVEGYGFAQHTILWAKKIPTLYAPILAFPVKTKRQTGLLAPRIGSSDRFGFEYEQPLFIALSRNTDATLYTDVMTDRGIKLGGQYRYVLSPQSKGTLFLDYLNDQKTDPTETQYQFSDTPNRTNADRYWFRMKADHSFDSGFTAKLDIDVVSDADYLQDFKEGFTGFNKVDTYFKDEFGRDLDAYDDTTRQNSLTLSKNWTHYSLSAQARWYDNVIARRNHDQDTTLQVLPSIQLNGARQSIGETSFYYSFSSQFNAFYRKDTAQRTNNPDGSEKTAPQIRGQRLDFFPTFYRPTQIAKRFHFTPYLGLRGTAWFTDGFTDVNGDDHDFRSRIMIDTGADFFFTLNKVFEPKLKFADKIQHRLVPKISYRFIPKVDQNDLPYFDEIDRMEEKNLFTWTLTNTFTAKTLATEEAPPQYKEIFWFELSQDYDLKNERDGKEAQGNSWSDIRLKTELRPFKCFSLDGEVRWNPYTSHFTKSNIGLGWSNTRGDAIHTALRYTKDTTHTWYTRLDTRLTDELKLYYSFEKDREKNTTIETIGGLEFQQDCWKLLLELKEDSEHEQSLGFMIILNGIGGFGNK